MSIAFIVYINVNKYELVGVKPPTTPNMLRHIIVGIQDSKDGHVSLINRSVRYAPLHGFALLGGIHISI